MTSGTGIECINLKKAKYIRDMKASRAQNVRNIPEAVEPMKAPAAQHRAPAAQQTSKARTHTANITAGAYDGGYTVKDLLGAVGNEAVRAIAAKRRRDAKARAYAPHYVAKKVKPSKAFPISAIGYIIVFSVIAMFLVLGNSKINEANLYAESIENQISEQANQNEILTSRLNMRNDAAAIEDYAINTLGLVRKSDVAKKYVSISGEDKVVVSGVYDSGYSAGGSVTMTLSSGN